MRIPIIIIRRVVGWGKSRRELALAQAIQLHVACDSRALPQRGALAGARRVVRDHALKQHASKSAAHHHHHHHPAVPC